MPTDTRPPSPADASSLADAAITWYDAEARDLPWREPGTAAWAVLVSEVMLQQTPVGRVLPAWIAWMARWPTPAALAADPVTDAIRAWGRLGYPRRALRLHDCAVAIVTHHDGHVPPGLDDLLRLPGIGSYTARAVAAFAFGQRQPVVDTNVRRFVARAVGGAADSGEATTAADLAAVEALLPAESARAARASAAFMELGALICTARAPRCTDCPIRTRCAWRRAGAPLPAGPTRRPQTYAGTHRQIRGRLLAVLREADAPVSRTHLDLAWPEAARREAALASLIADGLAIELVSGEFALGGHVDSGRHR